MVSVTDGNIVLSKGDTAIIVLEFEGDVPTDDATALVTLKRDPRDTSPVWEKRLPVEDGRVTVACSSQDTDHPFGRYWWDVRLICGDTVITPMPPKSFRIAEVVGDV